MTYIVSSGALNSTHSLTQPNKLSYDDHKTITGHRNYRSCDEVMNKLPYDEFVTIYDQHNTFRKYGN